MTDQLFIPAGTGKEALAVALVDASGAAVSGGAAANSLAVSRSGSIASGGVAQQLAAANAARRFIKGQNISSGDLWVNELGGTAAAATEGSCVVPPRATFVIETPAAISIVGATTGQKFTAVEV